MLGRVKAACGPPSGLASLGLDPTCAPRCRRGTPRRSARAQGKGDPAVRHERLIAYQKAKGFLSLALTAKARLPRGWGSTGDQLHRAAFSILLNTAEGAGPRKPAEKGHFYEVALGSTAECAALVDALELALPNRFGQLLEARRLLVEIQALLTALVKRFLRS